MKLNELFLKAVSTPHLPWPKPPRHLHQLMYSFVTIAALGLASAYLLRQNEAEHFSRLGSFILAVAFLRVTLVKIRFDEATSSWDRVRTFKHINETKSLNALFLKSLENSFGIRSAETYHLQLECGINPLFSSITREELSQFCAELNERLCDPSIPQESDEILAETQKFEVEYSKAMNFINTWRRTFVGLEAMLLIWGTLQWGYGDLLVIWLHS